MVKEKEWWIKEEEWEALSPEKRTELVIKAWADRIFADAPPELLLEKFGGEKTETEKGEGDEA